jgi:hypothetical protein
MHGIGHPWRMKQVLDNLILQHYRLLVTYTLALFVSKIWLSLAAALACEEKRLGYKRLRRF